MAFPPLWYWKFAWFVGELDFLCVPDVTLFCLIGEHATAGVWKMKIEMIVRQDGRKSV